MAKWTHKIVFKDSEQVVYYNESHCKGEGGWTDLYSWEGVGMSSAAYKHFLKRNGFEFEDLKLAPIQMENK